MIDVDEEAEVEESSCGTGAAALQTRRLLQLGQRQPIFGKYRDPDDHDNVGIDRDGIDNYGTDDYDIDNAAASTTAGIGARGPRMFNRTQKQQRNAGSASGPAPTPGPATAAAAVVAIAIAIFAAEERRE